MTYDVLLDESGDLPLYAQISKGPEVTLQRVRTRLQTFTGDWLLDQTAGLPFLVWAATKPAPVNTITVRIRDEIASTPGVLRVESVSSAYNRSTRRLTFTAHVILEGTVAIVSVGVPTDERSGNRAPLIHMTRSGPIVRGMTG